MYLNNLPLQPKEQQDTLEEPEIRHLFTVIIFSFLDQKCPSLSFFKMLNPF